MKRKDLEKALLDLGKKKGMLCFEELNEAFPAEYFPLEEMERFLVRLEALGVKVVEYPEARKTKPRHRRAA